MRFGVSNQPRNPHQHTKERQHERHQACREPRLAIEENGKRRECKRDGREYRPKLLIGRNPPWNKVSRNPKIEYLAHRK